MGQEYFINSQELEDKIRSLLPSQGGAGAGFDLSASTQIIPVIDLTESAEGSNVREDLQTSLSFSSVTAFDVSNTTTTIINNTGYYRVFGACSFTVIASTQVGLFRISDGATTKDLVEFLTDGSGTSGFVTPFDFNVFLQAGDSLDIVSSSTKVILRGCTRQIADIDGNLTNP